MEIVKYQLEDGKIPFDSWLRSLRDARAKARILIRLKRMETGNVGDSKPVGEGVIELRISEGQGYRVYYGRKGNEAVILLCGGNKSSQQNDIKVAKEYWRNYRENS
jgi:putative addiction module killer protein